MAGRKLMEFKGVKPNIAVIMGILPGTDGEIRMSKSLGNHIPLFSTPEDMYGKVMSIPDKAMGKYFRLVTRWTPAEIIELERGIEEGRLSPRDVKMKLAREIVTIYHSAEAAEAAEREFVRVFQEGKPPEEMDTYQLLDNQSVLEVLLKGKLVGSRSEARRMLQQKAVRLNGVTLSEPDQKFPDEGILQVGKRHYLRVVRG
jgi:tyrosyl-tRNA synthetase